MLVAVFGDDDIDVASCVVFVKYVDQTSLSVDVVRLGVSVVCVIFDVTNKPPTSNMGFVVNICDDSSFFGGVWIPLSSINVWKKLTFNRSTCE